MFEKAKKCLLVLFLSLTIAPLSYIQAQDCTEICDTDIDTIDLSSMTCVTSWNPNALVEHCCQNTSSPFSNIVCITNMSSTNTLHVKITYETLPMLSWQSSLSPGECECFETQEACNTYCKIQFGASSTSFTCDIRFPSECA